MFPTMFRRLRRPMLAAAALALLAPVAPLPAQALPRAGGYRGIWYSNQPTKDEFGFKYSGGMATYPQQHLPIAVYAPAVRKTFFCYGGTVPGKRELLHMVSYYDHATGTVPPPVVLLNKKTGDAHDNPTMQIDEKGHLWIFSAAHGTARRAYIHRSVRPYQIDRFELIDDTNFSYPQPWHLPGQGFVFLHTRYGRAPAMGGSTRGLHWMTSADGRKWGEPRLLARIGLGDYQVSWRHGKKLGTAFDYHPPPVGLNARTNLYYLETADAGATWRTAGGRAVAVPLTAPDNPALVRDYEKEKLLVYLKDLQFADGRPVILYLTSKGYHPGPKNGPRTWHTARWTGKEWEVRPVTTSDHNYDHGSLYVEPDGTWRLIAPTDPGPQPHGTGGEMVLWTSRDQGKVWTRVKALTSKSARNHSYARRPLGAHPDFYALWADGDPLKPSESHLYFTDRAGSRVWRLPPAMGAEAVRPEVAW